MENESGETEKKRKKTEFAYRKLLFLLLPSVHSKNSHPHIAQTFKLYPRKFAVHVLFPCSTTLVESMF